MPSMSEKEQQCVGGQGQSPMNFHPYCMVQVEKGGMDEAFVDLTKEARLRVAHATGGGGFHGHIHLCEVQRSSR